MKYGRNGSIAVKLPTHVPPIPSASSTSGPTQHTDAPTAASAPAISDPLSLSCDHTILLHANARALKGRE